MKKKKNKSKSIKGIIGIVILVAVVIFSFATGNFEVVQDILNGVETNISNSNDNISDTVIDIGNSVVDNVLNGTGSNEQNTTESSIANDNIVELKIADNGNPIISNELKIHYIDVGQGDSILLQNESTAILIDGGPRECADKLVEYIKQQQIKTLTYVVATHPHEDHIGSLDDVINEVETVENVWMPKKTSNTATFKALVTAIKNKNLTAEQPEIGKTVIIGDLKMTVLGPVKDYSDTNDWSIVIKVEYKDNSFIFTGDAEATAEKDVLGLNMDLSADVLKAGHHGSSTSTSEEFFKAVNPTYAVISLGEGNSYGHPHTETLELLKKYNIVTYRTDRNGTVVLTSDGKNISFEVEKGSAEGYTDTLKATNIE